LTLYNNPRRGLIAMRFNMEYRETFERVCHGAADGMDYFAKLYGPLMKRIGAFRKGPAFTRLDRIGVTRESLLWTANLMPPAPQGVKWNKELAERLAEVGRNDFCRNMDLLFLCGKPVAEAFGANARHGVGDVVVITKRTKGVIIPHPSGLNRWWQDDAAVLELAETIRDLTH